MDRYKWVEKPRTETPINENEIRVTTQGMMRNYITYASTLLQEKGSTEIVLKAMGSAINKTVMIAELIKRRIVGLHQNTSIGSTDITATWKPLEEGLLPLETTRHVSMITITLSKEELDTSSTGYQSPIPADQVKPLTEFEYEGEPLPGVRGRGRGGRGRGRDRGFANGVADNNGDGGWDGGHGYGRGRGCGRGRDFRGRGRGYGGGYGGGDMHQESGGYNEFGGPEAPPSQGRGRGRGTVRGRGRGQIYRTVGPEKETIPGELSCCTQSRYRSDVNHEEQKKEKSDFGESSMRNTQPVDGPQLNVGRDYFDANKDEQNLQAGTGTPGSSHSSYTGNGDMPQTQNDLIGEREKHKESDEYRRAAEEEWAARQRQVQIQAEEAQKLRQRIKAENLRKQTQNDLISEREKHKQSEEYRHAAEEEWASRQRQIQIQAAEAQKLRKKIKAENMLKKKQKQRLEEMRDSQKKNEETIHLKEQIRVQIRKELDKMEVSYTDMASLLRELGIHVEGGDFPLYREVNAAYRRALLRFHPDRASKTDIRKQVEAEETFKLISRMKEKLLPGV